MTAGRPPKPIEQKRRLGNPGKRTLPDEATVTILPALVDRSGVPGHLGAAGEAVWRTVTDQAHSWLAPGDEPVIRLLCEAADRRNELLARLESDGPVLFTDKGYAYAHPVVGMISTIETQMTKWLSLLGFTPTDRAKLALGEVKRASKLEQLLASRTSRQPGSASGA